MLSRPIPDLELLSSEERSEYLFLERRKNTLQHALGTLSHDVEEVRKVVHRIRELETIAVLRAEYNEIRGCAHTTAVATAAR